MVVALVHAILFRREQNRIWGGRSGHVYEENEEVDRTPLLARSADTS
jgi:hypothetical protein